MIHEEICTYEVAKSAKEKGFDVQTFDWYDYTGNYYKGLIPHELHECPRYKEYYAPTQSLLQRWLREENGYAISVTAYPTLATMGKVCYAWEIKSSSDGHYMKAVDGEYTFSTYELALEDALKYALENLV